MIINKAIVEPKRGTKHKPSPDCPICDCVNIQQPWPSMIALGFKYEEFRSKRVKQRGRVRIVASALWFNRELRALILEHFTRYTSEPLKALDALFPVSVPVADAEVADCVQRGEADFVITLKDVRIITQPKPVLKGAVNVPWKLKDGERGNNLALAVEAFDRARPLEGKEKDDVYRELGLPRLRDKINDWLKVNGLADFTMKARS
jgi:hypothetical protein